VCEMKESPRVTVCIVLEPESYSSLFVVVVVPEHVFLSLCQVIFSRSHSKDNLICR